MPRATPAIVARRAAILATARRHPDWPYVDIATEVERLGHHKPSKSLVYLVVHDLMPGLDSNWRKVNRRRRTYACVDCGAAFAGETGYSGYKALRCPKCRQRRSNRGSENRTGRNLSQPRTDDAQSRAGG